MTVTRALAFTLGGNLLVIKDIQLNPRRPPNLWLGPSQIISSVLSLPWFYSPYLLPGAPHIWMNPKPTFSTQTWLLNLINFVPLVARTKHLDFPSWDRPIPWALFSHLPTVACIVAAGGSHLRPPPVPCPWVLGAASPGDSCHVPPGTSGVCSQNLEQIP